MPLHARPANPHAPIPTSRGFHYPIPDADYPMPSQANLPTCSSYPTMSNTYDPDRTDRPDLPELLRSTAHVSLLFASPLPAAMDHLSRSVLSFRLDIAMHMSLPGRAYAYRSNIAGMDPAYGVGQCEHCLVATAICPMRCGTKTVVISYLYLVLSNRWTLFLSVSSQRGPTFSPEINSTRSS